MRKISILIYQKDKVKSWLASTPEECREFLTSNLKQKNDIELCLESIAKQQEDSELFPNILLFLNDDCDTIHINQFMKINLKGPNILSEIDDEE